jgi:hypothetical protein
MKIIVFELYKTESVVLGSRVSPLLHFIKYRAFFYRRIITYYIFDKSVSKYQYTHIHTSTLVPVPTWKCQNKNEKENAACWCETLLNTLAACIFPSCFYFSSVIFLLLFTLSYLFISLYSFPCFLLFIFFVLFLN